MKAIRSQRLGTSVYSKPLQLWNRISSPGMSMNLISSSTATECSLRSRQTGIAPKEPKVFNPEIARKYFVAFLGATGGLAEGASLSQLAEECAKYADGQSVLAERLWGRMELTTVRQAT